MVSRADIVRVSRTWLGTPFIHQGRLRGSGVDCVGVAIGVAHELSLSDFDFRTYAMQPDARKMRELLHAHLDPVEKEQAQAGDLLWFRIDIDPQHIALLVETEPRWIMLHAFGKRGVMQVVENGVDSFWLKRLVGCFRYRGIE